MTKNTPKKISRQRKWQIQNPDKAKLLKVQAAIRKRYQLLQAGFIKTHEELWEMVKDYEKRQGLKLSGQEWWNIYEYLDWKYNNSAFTDLSFSRKLELL